MDEMVEGLSGQKINVLYDFHEILSEHMMPLEVTKMQNIIKAKKEFNERKDVEFYISADDLLYIQTIKIKIHIK